MPRSKRIYIAWDEWNVWYRARSGAARQGRRALEEHYNLEDALVVATFLNTFVNHSHIVKMANLAQLVNVIAPIFTNDDGLYLQTIYHPLAMFAANTRGKALDLFVDSPKYDNKRFGEVPALDASAALDKGTLVLNVLNRSKDQPMAVEFEAEDKKFSGTVAITEVNGADIKAENDFTTIRVKPAVRTATAQGGKFTVQLAPHSYTMLKVKLV
jgi:alpha-N-arabinofuranosidase